MRVLSFGAGVQSTALLVLSNQEKIERADVAIFADTQDEPKYVYEHIEWAKKWSKIPIEVVTKGKLSGQFGTVATRFAPVPAFSSNGTGLLRRQCTREYKIEPIQRKIRELSGYKKGQRIPKGTVEMMIGISIDEERRCKPNMERWITNRWPLIELRMNRRDCVKLLDDMGLPVPFKSSCVYCPYHRDTYWRWLKEKCPADYEQACVVDEKIRNMGMKVKSQMFIHRSLKPLREIDFTDYQVEMFGDFHKECTGYCGV
jgi:hypothetical protein